jgi:hypothetical protein
MFCNKRYTRHYLHENVSFSVLYTQRMESDTPSSISTNQWPPTCFVVPSGHQSYVLETTNQHYIDTCIANANIFETYSNIISRTTTTQLGNPSYVLQTTKPYNIDIIVADANLFATQIAVIATITALSNTNRQLAMLDILIPQNSLAVLATVAINSEDE